MKNNKKWFSLVIAIVMVIVMSLMAWYILAYIMPFAKNTKSIEQSVSAYYLADSAVEEALHSIKNTLWKEFPNPMEATATWYSIQMTASWTIMPVPGQWNSEYDSDYNIIRAWEPIQIEVWKNSVNLSDFDIIFRVPDLNWDDSYDEELKKQKDSKNIKYVNWQLSSEIDVLNSSESQFESDDIKNWEDITFFTSPDMKGFGLNKAVTTLENFYGNKCGDNWCILKMSIINKLELTDWTSVPYLEWKIKTWDSAIPLRYTIIETTWKSYEFQKKLKVRVPQQTVNEAFDFTVFQ